MRLIDQTKTARKLAGMYFKTAAKMIHGEYKDQYDKLDKAFDIFNDLCEQMIESVKNAPTIDAVPVVRCGKCEYYAETNGKDTGKPCGYGQCKNPFGLNGVVYEDSYCSYGERRCWECRYGHYLSSNKLYECHHPLYTSFTMHNKNHFCGYSERKC